MHTEEAAAPFLLSIGNVYVDINCANMPELRTIEVEKEIINSSYQLTCGGSALNVAVTATKLGFSAAIVASIGDDDMGTILESLCIKAGVRPIFSTDSKLTTNVGLNFIDMNGQTTMFALGSANAALSGDFIISALTAQQQVATYLYLGGIAKSPQLRPQLKEIIRTAQQLGILTVLDHGRVGDGINADDRAEIRNLCTMVDIYLPSYDEFLNVWETNSIEAGIEAFATDHSSSLKSPIICVKNGKYPAQFLTESKTIQQVPVFATEGNNYVGAGDSFNIGFLTGLYRQLPLETSVRMGHAVASLHLSHNKNISFDTARSMLE